jgi:hypothetical protein
MPGSGGFNYGPLYQSPNDGVLSHYGVVTGDHWGYTPDNAANPVTITHDQFNQQNVLIDGAGRVAMVGHGTGTDPAQTVFFTAQPHATDMHVNDYGSNDHIVFDRILTNGHALDYQSLLQGISCGAIKEHDTDTGHVVGGHHVIETTYDISGVTGSGVFATDPQTGHAPAPHALHLAIDHSDAHALGASDFIATA